MNRATPLRWSQVGLVAIGGAAGTALREGALVIWPAEEGMPFTVLLVNVLRALLLGVLYAVLSRSPESDARRGARALLGAGVLGGFTTYGALAGDTARLWDGEPLAAAAYASLSVVAGV